jgi:acyl-CoA thioesterase
MGESIFTNLDTRVALGRTFDELDGTPGSTQSALWVRLPGQLTTSAATLAIFGDYVSGGNSEPLGLRVMGRSLDNTIRIANLAPTEWVLVDIQMHALVGGFAQGIGFLWSQDGQLLGTASQTIAAKIWEG